MVENINTPRSDEVDVMEENNVTKIADNNIYSLFRKLKHNYVYRDSKQNKRVVWKFWW